MRSSSLYIFLYLLTAIFYVGIAIGAIGSVVLIILGQNQDSVSFLILVMASLILVVCTNYLMQRYFIWPWEARELQRHLRFPDYRPAYEYRGFNIRTDLVDTTYA